MTKVLGKVYTPFNLPKDFVVGQEFGWHYNHYGPEEANLCGDLCKMSAYRERQASLVAAVWDLLRELMGPRVFDPLGKSNVVPWAAPHDADKGGRDILAGVSADALAVIATRQTELLLSLGNVVLLTSCGGAADAWFELTGIGERFGTGPANSECVRAAGRRPIAADLCASPGRHRPTVAGCLGRRPHPEFFLEYLPAEKHYKRLSTLIALHGGPPDAGRTLRDKMGPAYDVLLRKQQEGGSLGGAPTCLAPPRWQSACRG